MITVPVLFVCLFTGIIHFTETLVYAFRLAGVQTRCLAISMSLFTSALLISRLSNMLQAPLLGTMIDQVIHTNASLITLTHNFRYIIGIAGLGSLIGVLITPVAIPLFQRIILSFQANGSVIRLIISRVIWPRWSDFQNYRAIFQRLSRLLSAIRHLPKPFLVLNIIVTAVYTIGVLCALYAGAIVPEFRATAIQLSGLINGIATILLTLFVDPALARITDQTLRHNRPDTDIKAAILWLLLGRLVGIFILAQLLFMPFSQYLARVTQWLATLSAGAM